jgi:hypothetical protein
MLASGPETDEISAYVDGLAPELPLEVLPALYAPKLDDAAGWQAPVVRVGDRHYSAADYDAWLRRNEGELIAQRLALLASVELAGRRAGVELRDEQIEARIELDRQLIIDEAFKGRPELWENDLRLRRRTTEIWRQEARERARMDLTAEALLFADENWLEQPDRQEHPRGSPRGRRARAPLHEPRQRGGRAPLPRAGADQGTHPGWRGFRGSGEA